MSVADDKDTKQHIRDLKNENEFLNANCATDRTVLRSKTDAERSERTP